MHPYFGSFFSKGRQKNFTDLLPLKVYTTPLKDDR